MTAADDFVSFSRLIIALDPWLDQLVIIGGWAHRLYRLHPYAQALEYPPLTTRDADIAIPPTLLAGEQDIRARLLAKGFTEEFLGDDQPPATHYRLGDEAAGFSMLSSRLHSSGASMTAKGGGRRPCKSPVSHRSG